MFRYDVAKEDNRTHYALMRGRIRVANANPTTFDRTFPQLLISLKSPTRSSPSKFHNRVTLALSMRRPGRANTGCDRIKTLYDRQSNLIPDRKD